MMRNTLEAESREKLQAALMGMRNTAGRMKTRRMRKKMMVMITSVIVKTKLSTANPGNFSVVVGGKQK